MHRPKLDEKKKEKCKIKDNEPMKRMLILPKISDEETSDVLNRSNLSHQPDDTKQRSSSRGFKLFICSPSNFFS